MKLEIENGQIVNCINVLDKLSLKGLKSIYRTRLSKELTKKLERVGEEQTEIQKDYFELDEEGNPKVTNDLKHCKDVEGYNETMKQFIEAKVVVDGGDSRVMLESVKNSLEETDEDFSGKDAYAFEYLYTQLEEGSKADDSDNSENEDSQ